tara:strand:+ start:830 stop:1174 length:345 start_codon:yes stop_codon:yes gene_type:complete
MPDYVQLSLWKPYDPQVNDYVIWDRGKYGKDEGWVYFKGDPPVHKRGFPDKPRYITIETSVKPKPPCKYTNGKDVYHKMIHTLILCYEKDWCQLEYIKSRTPSEQIQHYSQCDD